MPVNAGSPEFQFATIEVIPAPAGAALLGLGGLVAARRRRD
ncbi:MAG: LPXTG cell wall anchor domain-containing protein [Planctomycetes bacterium]|nr:LPXTG cell wall anchor domain-containing protein [Planctomycetota bacterium]